MALALRQHFCYPVFYLTRKKKLDACSPLPTHTSHSTAQLTLAPLKTNQYLTSHPSRVQSHRSSCWECGPEFLLCRWGCVSLTIPLTSGIVSTPAKWAHKAPLGLNPCPHTLCFALQIWCPSVGHLSLSHLLCFCLPTSPLPCRSSGVWWHEPCSWVGSLAGGFRSHLHLLP